MGLRNNNVKISVNANATNEPVVKKEKENIN